MLNVLSYVPSMIAAAATYPVPDSGLTAILVSGGVLSLGLFARFLKNRKK